MGPHNEETKRHRHKSVNPHTHLPSGNISRLRHSRSCKNPEEKCIHTFEFTQRGSDHSPFFPNQLQIKMCPKKHKSSDGSKTTLSTFPVLMSDSKPHLPFFQNQNDIPELLLNEEKYKQNFEEKKRNTIHPIFQAHQPKQSYCSVCRITYDTTYDQHIQSNEHFTNYSTNPFTKFIEDIARDYLQNKLQQQEKKDSKKSKCFERSKTSDPRNFEYSTTKAVHLRFPSDTACEKKNNEQPLFFQEPSNSRKKELLQLKQKRLSVPKKSDLSTMPDSGEEDDRKECIDEDFALFMPKQNNKKVCRRLYFNEEKQEKVTEQKEITKDRKIFNEDSNQPSKQSHEIQEESVLNLIEQGGIHQSLKKNERVMNNKIRNQKAVEMQARKKNKTGMKTGIRANYEKELANEDIMNNNMSISQDSINREREGRGKEKVLTRGRERENQQKSKIKNNVYNSNNNNNPSAKKINKSQKQYHDSPDHNDFYIEEIQQQEINVHHNQYPNNHQAALNRSPYNLRSTISKPKQQQQYSQEQVHRNITSECDHENAGVNHEISNRSSQIHRSFQKQQENQHYDLYLYEENNILNYNISNNNIDGSFSFKQNQNSASIFQKPRKEAKKSEEKWHWIEAKNKKRSFNEYNNDRGMRMNYEEEISINKKFKVFGIGTQEIKSFWQQFKEIMADKLQKIRETINI